MNVIEINKYSPGRYRNARYLTQDWTSVAQVGETWNGAVLTAEAYLEVEDRYVRAAERFLSAASITELRIHGLEFWEEPLASQPLLPPTTAPRDGAVVTSSEVGPLLRRFLRELAWAELIVAPRFLLHTAHDFRMLIACDMRTDEVEAEIRRDGLFTYPGDPGIATLDAWRRR